MKYYIKTYGCQMNVNDSEILSGILETKGYQETNDYRSADLVLVNTCAIRQKAEDKAYGFLGDLKGLKKEKPDLIIGICGCIPQHEKEKILKKLPFVDLVMGPSGIEEFGNLLSEVETKKETITFFGDDCIPRGIHPSKRAKIPRAYINIMYGCNNYCSYCIVPYVRGREICRPVKDIIDEIKTLDKSIYKEVFLLGQNVNSWQGDRGEKFSDLLKIVHELQQIKWLSFMTSHPKDFTDDIIDAVANSPKINHYIHLPIQSGSSKILAAMNRKYDRDYYLRVVDKIYSKIPDVALTSDIIVGFPGETDQDFQDSLDIIKKAEFDSVNTLVYSIRPDTKAAAMDNQIDDKIKKERLQGIMRIVSDMAFEKNQKLVNKTVDVLVEGEAKDGRLSGRTRGSKVVYFEGKKELLFQIVPVEIKSAKSWVLEGLLFSGL